jgi:hypothetical protein
VVLWDERLEIRISRDGLRVLDAVRGELTCSEFVRRLIAAECARPVADLAAVQRDI